MDEFSWISCILQKKNKNKTQKSFFPKYQPNNMSYENFEVPDIKILGHSRNICM